MAMQFDPHDSQFGTKSNRRRVVHRIDALADQIDAAMLKHESIVEVVSGPAGNTIKHYFSERDMKVILFALRTASDSIEQ